MIYKVILDCNLFNFYLTVGATRIFSFELSFRKLNQIFDYY